MIRRKKLAQVPLMTFMFLTAAVPTTLGIHIMEGYLSPVCCVAWGVIRIPFLALRIRSIKKSLEEDRKNIMLFAMTKAFIFVVSSLKIPSVTGSCSHMAGTGLDAILFGPTTVSIFDIVVLLFQAPLLTHDGVTTLRANTFSMAIAGLLLSYPIYRICEKGSASRTLSVFLAAFLGDTFTYCMTSLRLAIVCPSVEDGIGASTVKFLGVFASTQLPLAIIEGVLAVIIVIALETYAKPELRAIGLMKEAA